MPAALFAHAPVAPGELWGAWARQPAALIVLAAFVVAYGQGVRSGSAGAAMAPVLRRRRRAATGAVVVLAVALVSPLEAAASSLFSVHMVQHLLLATVAAPLLALAEPARTIRRGLSPVGRRTVDVLWRPWRGDDPRRRWAPLAATLVALATLSIWHVPAAYDAALTSELVHAAEHTSILVTATVLWWAVFAAARRRQVLSAVVALAVACIHGGALGALLALSSVPWYAGHARRAAAWGVDAVADQQIAGAAMWVPTAAVYLVAMAAILHRWFRDADPVPAGTDVAVTR